MPLYGTELLYGPFIEMLRKWIGAEEGEAELAVRTKLRATLGLLPASQLPDVLPYLARLLSIKLDPHDDDRLRRLAPDELRSGIRRAYRTWLTALAAKGPIVVAIEDIHWADPSTRELVDDVLELADAMPMLFICTSRIDPESEGWKIRVRILMDFAHRAVELPLGPLSDDAARQLLAQRPKSRELDPVELELIVAGAEGNPLYLEELLIAFAEGKGPRRGQTWAGTMTSRVLTPTLESLLVARIDRLPPGARRLAQVAAVVGRRFPHRVLEHVADTENLDGELAMLLRADIIREFRRYPEPEYVFRHGLLRTASLTTLPRRGAVSCTAPSASRSRRSSWTRSTTTWRCSPTTSRGATTSGRRSTTSSAPVIVRRRSTRRLAPPSWAARRHGSRRSSGTRRPSSAFASSSPPSACPASSVEARHAAGPLRRYPR